MTVSLSHRYYGSGRPLVILHGLFGSAVNWNTIARKLSRDYPVYAVDLRNHGDSPHADAMEYRSMAADVVGFLDSLGIAHAVLVGHSMGGKVAMVTALEHSRRVNRLVVVDIAPVSYTHEFDTILDALDSVDLHVLSSREQANEILAQSIAEASLRSFLLQNLRKEHGAWRWRINLDAVRRNIPSLVGFPEAALRGKTYPGEVLFLGGSESPYVQPDHHASIRSYFPHARVDTLAGVGHWLHAERPVEFVSTVREFLHSRPG